MFKAIANKVDDNSTVVKNISRSQYYVLYSIVFIIVSLLVFASFFVNGKSFLWQEDGWVQHYKALLYYAKWLRSIIKTLIFEGRLEIPTYSFSIGYGSDLITTLSYYVIGDPLCLFSVFVPTKYMANFYCALILLRFYLAGVTFSAFCFYMENKIVSKEDGGVGKIAVLAGALVYIFCGFAIFGGVRHPYFLNPMIYFPLVLIGCEKIFNKQRPYVFVLSVFVSAISNFYFFYMIAILTVLYVIWRMSVYYSKTEIKRIIGMFAKFAGYSVLGICMSAVILLPSLLALLNSNRSESGYVYDLLYNLSDYEGYFGGLLTSNTGVHDWLVMGYGGIVLVALFALFVKKNHKDLKIVFLVLTMMTLIPSVGYIMNGFSYVTNRWIWGYSFFLAYVVVVMWKSLFSLTFREKKLIFLCLAVYFLLCFVFEKSRTTSTMFALSIALLIFGIICLVEDSHNFRISQVLLVTCIAINITGNAVYLYSQRESGYVKEFLDYDSILYSLKYNEAVAIDNVNDTDEFFRYSGSSITPNGTLYSGQHSTQYYWSLENGNITDFRNEMCLSDSIISYNYKTLDSRTILSTLANVKYYVQGSSVPYGFSLVGSETNYSSIDEYLDLKGLDYSEEELTDDEKQTVSSQITTYQIWGNDYFLPFGYTYDGYISLNDYEKMTPLEKQEAMLQGCVIESDTPKGSEAIVSFTGQVLEYEVSDEGNVAIEDNRIAVTKANSTITLTFDGIANAETYLYITGLSYLGTEPVDRYTDLQWDLLSVYDKNEVLYSQKYYEDSTTLNITVSANNAVGGTTSKTLTYYTSENLWYIGRDDFLINLGYDEESKVSITIQFPAVGEYIFESLEVQCQPMDNYPDQIESLAEDVMQNVDFHNDNAAYATNTVTGTINLNSAKYLLMTIPYSDGWTAYVDGEEQEIYQANTMYMALYLEAGDHEIIMVYRTPGLRAGFILSCVSAAVMVILLLWNKKERKPVK